MAEILATAAILPTVLVRLVDGVKREASYLCCFKSHFEDFENYKSRLSASVQVLQEDIKEARNRRESLIEPDVERWLEKANDLIQADTTTNKTCCFGLCSNCIWKYARAKELAYKKQEIQILTQKGYTFNLFAHLPQLPTYQSTMGSEFKQLKEALKDHDNNYMIGLYGMGGSGKTTMAAKLCKKIVESKLFDRVIWASVADFPDVTRIQLDIARQLGLSLQEGKESENAEILWSRIAKGGEKVLVVLDDVWEVLDLKHIGIPTGPHHKAYCSVLLTTRDPSICEAMGCQKMIKLERYSYNEALNLFLFHAGISDDSSDEFKDVASNILEMCGGLPFTIVTVARTLKSKPLIEWKAALNWLQNFDLDVHEDLRNAHRSVSLSLHNIDNDEGIARLLFLLFSLFPEDFEIPIEHLSRIAIGLGLGGKVDKYYAARSKVLPMTHELIESCLLLKAEKECVKMHDLVREVALLIGKKEIQVVMDSTTNLKKNIRYSSWNIEDFPNHFDGSKLEILLVWIKTNGSLEVPHASFEGMKRLRVLFLICTNESSRIPASSFLQSIHSLKNIRTLLLTNWELGDISIMGSLQELETFELNNCSITEFPIQVRRLTKLRLLGLRNCIIEWNNPFQVIQICLGLEELYYVENSDILYRGNRDEEELPQITIPPALKRYHIIGSQFPNSLEVDASISRCFIPGVLQKIFSEATIKLFLANAEILELGKYYGKAGWRNLIPDIVPMEDGGGMKDLIRLSLYDWSEIECLILTEHLQTGVSIFSKLVELKLCNVDVKELCRGPLPIDFLKQLEELDLRECLKLESILFKGILDLGKLKSIKLERCSMTSLFHSSTAQSLQQLETLSLCECYQLKYIMDDYDPRGRTDGSIFPKLKFLNVKCCDDLKFILPIFLVEGLPLLEEIRLVSCQKIKYIFGQHPDVGGLYEMGNEIILPSLKVMEISGMPDFIYIFPAECYHPMSSIMQNSSPTSTRDKDPSPTNTFSWAPLCCFLPKSSAKSMNNTSVSKATLMDRTGSLKLKTQVSNRAECFLRPPLDPRNMREIKITNCSSFTSLLTLSFALSMSLLEKLEVGECHGLKHILADEEDSHDDLTYSHIFRNLREFSVWNCNLLESSIPAYVYRIPDAVNFLKSFKISSVQCLLTRPLHLRHMRHLKITHCSSFTSLLTLSVASSMSLLDKIQVGDCDELKHIFTNDRDDDDHRNYSSIFPNLQEVFVWNCDLLESLFPASHFKTLDRLKSLRISGTPKLRYVLGKCECDDSSTHQSQPAQESRQDVPNMSKKKAADEVDEEELEMQKLASSLPPSEGTNTSANTMVEQVPISIIPAMTTPSSSSDMNNEVSIGEGPSSDKYNKATSSTDTSHRGSLSFTKELREQKSIGDREAFGESISNSKACQRVDKPFVEEFSSIERSNQTALEIPPKITEMKDLTFNLVDTSLDNTSSPPQAVTLATHTEPGSLHPNPSSPQSQIMVNQTETYIDEEAKADQISPQQFGDDDLHRLFRLMEKGADIGVRMSHVSKMADNEVAKAFSDLEASLKMGLQEIASSEEDSLRLENALNFLSTHYSEDEASPNYGLKSIIQSLHQQIPRILSSFKQVSASKEKEIRDCEIKLSFLQEQRKNSVSETIQFQEEFEAVKKEMSKIVEDKLKERQELERWSSCVAKWWKAKLL